MAPKPELPVAPKPEPVAPDAQPGVLEPQAEAAAGAAAVAADAQPGVAPPLAQEGVDPEALGAAQLVAPVAPVAPAPLLAPHKLEEAGWVCAAAGCAQPKPVDGAAFEAVAAPVGASGPPKLKPVAWPNGDGVEPPKKLAAGAAVVA